MTEKDRLAGSVDGHGGKESAGGSSLERPAKRKQHRPQISLPFASDSDSPVVSDREQLRALLSSLPVICFVLDRQSHLTMLEGKGVSLLVPSQQSLLGRPISELYQNHTDVREQLATAFDGTAVTWTERVGDLELTTTLTPLRNRDDVVTGVLGVGILPSNNIPAGVSTAEELQSSVDAFLSRNQLFAQVSHEIRAPLNSIVSFANLLMENKESHFDAQDLFYVQRIKGNATHLIGVAEDMMDLSAIEMGKAKLVHVEVDLAELILETIAEIGSGQRRDSVELRTEIPDGARPIETDRQKLKQVLINLISNALKYTERGFVTVGFGVDEFLRPFRVDVRDTGMGIKAENLDTIFEAFERGDQGANKEIEGTGLGLTVTRALCALLGYTIRVTSEPGKGSTFTIDFAGTPASQSR